MPSYERTDPKIAVVCKACGTTNFVRDIPSTIVCTACSANRVVGELNVKKAFRRRKSFALHRRWSRKECIQWLIDFAFEHSGNATILRSVPLNVRQLEIDAFIASVSGRRVLERFPAKEIGDLRSKLKGRLWEMNATHFWVIRGQDLPSLAEAEFIAGFGRLEFTGMTIQDVSLMCCLLSLASREATLVSKCTRKGCPRLFIRLRRSAYCCVQCSRWSEAEQARRRRADPSRAAQRRRARRARYETLMRRQGKTEEQIRHSHKLWEQRERSAPRKSTDQG
jgi:hypothetical protein